MKAALKAVEVGVEQCDILMFDLQLLLRQRIEGTEPKPLNFEYLLTEFLNEIDEAIVCSVRVLTGSDTANSIVTSGFRPWRMPIPSCRGGDGTNTQRTFRAPTNAVECLDSSLFGPNSSAANLLRVINTTRMKEGGMAEREKRLPPSIANVQEFADPQNMSKTLEEYRRELMEWRKGSELALNRSLAADVLSHLSKLPDRLYAMRTIYYWWPRAATQIGFSVCIIC